MQSPNSTQVMMESASDFVQYTKHYLQNIPNEVIRGRINQTIEQVSIQR